MSDQTAAALQALIQQVSSLTEKVEAQDKKFHDVYKMNADLLTKIKGPKDGGSNDAAPKPDFAALLTKLETTKIETPYRKAGDPVQLTRSEALDVTKYQQAQKLSQEQGVPLEIVDDRPGHEDDVLPPNSVYKEVDTSAIDMVQDDAQKIRHVRQDIAYGGAGYVQNSMAAEREGFCLRTFKYKDDLPDHMSIKLELMARAQEAQGGGDVNE